MGHLDSAKGCLVGVDDLVQEVEIYVGAITMIQVSLDCLDRIEIIP